MKKHKIINIFFTRIKNNIVNQAIETIKPPKNNSSNLLQMPFLAQYQS